MTRDTADMLTEAQQRHPLDLAARCGWLRHIADAPGAAAWARRAAREALDITRNGTPEGGSRG